MKPERKPWFTRMTILLLVFAAALLSGCAKQDPQPQPTVMPPPVTEPEPGTDYAEGKELFAAANTEEEAEQLAELYGIKLVEYSEGLAVFHTEENPPEVVRRGEENGWPALEVNYLVTAFDETR